MNTTQTTAPALQGLPTILAMHSELEAEFTAEKQAAQKRAAPLVYAQVDDHAQDGEFTNVQDFLTFMLAGNATFTIRSKATQNRFTFKVMRPEETSGAVRPMWIRVLNGADNTGDYRFVGTIWPRDVFSFNVSRKSGFSETAPSVLALRWLCKMLTSNPDGLLKQAQIWHEGRCGRCGRKLTVPSSIASGIGPECAKHS